MKYPDRRKLALEAEAPHRLRPARAPGCCAIAIAVSLIAALCAACKPGMNAETKLHPPGERTIVAPVFEHGEGFGTSWKDGLREDEALELLRDVLAQHGFSGFGPGKTFADLTYQTRHESEFFDFDSLIGRRKSEWTYYGVFGDAIDEPDFHMWFGPRKRMSNPTQSERRLSVDLYDPALEIGIEFVSKDDAESIATRGVELEPETRPVLTQDAAHILASVATDLTGPRVVVFFYDPQSAYDENIPEPLLRPSTDVDLEEYIEFKRRHDPVPKGFPESAARKRRKEWARQNDRRNLEMQARDFVEWFRKQDRGEKCRVGGHDYTYMPYRSMLLTGTVGAEGGYCGREKHGPWTHWNWVGEILSRGSYEAGVEVGWWEHLHPFGNVQKVGSYRRGKRHGTWLEFSYNGILLEAASYEEGKLVGSYFHKVDERESRWLLARFPDGDAKVWRDGEVELEFRVKNRLADGPIHGVTRGGSRVSGFLKKGAPHGRWTTTESHGCLSAEGDYRNGIPEGPWRFGGYESVNKECVVFIEVPFVGGRKNGFGRSTPESACFSGVNYVDDLEEGVAIHMAPAGRVAYFEGDLHACSVHHIGAYSKGRKVGRWVEFWDNDCLMSEGEYSTQGPGRENKDGLWIYRLRNPSTGECEVIREENYRHGHLNGLRRDTSTPTVREEHYRDGLLDGTQTIRNLRVTEGMAFHHLRELVGDPRPIDVETQYERGFFVGVQKYWLQNGRYYRECRYQPYRRKDDVEATTGSTDVEREPSSAERNSVRCLTWQEPEHVLLEDGGYLAGYNLYSDYEGWLGLEPALIFTKVDLAMPHGPFVRFWPNGRKRAEGDFDSGMHSGDWMTWYENGRPRERGRLDKDGYVGSWTYWHENGQQGVEGEYLKGNQHGRWTYWSRAGRKIGEILYDTGKVVASSCWNERGRPVECQWIEWPTILGSRPGPATDFPLR